MYFVVVHYSFDVFVSEALPYTYPIFRWQLMENNPQEP